MRGGDARTVDADVVGMFDDGAPVLLGQRLGELGRVNEGDHGVHGVPVVRDDDPLGLFAVRAFEEERLRLIEHALVARNHGGELRRRIVEAEQPRFAVLGAADAQHEVTPVRGQLKAQPHGDVVLLVNHLIVGDGRAQDVGLDLIRAPGIVHHGVEDAGAVGGEADAVEDVLDDVRQQLAGAEVLDAQGEAFVAGVVHGVGVEVPVHRDGRAADGEERLALGLDVAVQQDFLARDLDAGLHRGGSPVGHGVAGVLGADPALDAVLLALHGAAEVPPAVLAVRDRQVCLLRAALDFLEDGLAQRRLVGGDGLLVGVLGLQMVHHLGRVLLAQPLVVVHEGVAVVGPLVPDLLGHRRPDGAGEQT